MLLRRRIGAFVAAWTFLLPGAAAAQDDPAPESVRGIQIVIPEARGRRAWGRADLSKSLRRTMVQAVGPLVPSRDLDRAQRKLKQRRRQRRRPEGLAAAGKEIGAQFVLDVAITKKGWLYTARALLINTQTGEVQMDFRSQFYKPRKEAGDRGERIGARTIEKLATLIADGAAPALAAANGDSTDVRLDDDGDDALASAGDVDRIDSGAAAGGGSMAGAGSNAGGSPSGTSAGGSSAANADGSTSGAMAGANAGGSTSGSMTGSNAGASTSGSMTGSNAGGSNAGGSTGGTGGAFASGAGGASSGSSSGFGSDATRVGADVRPARRDDGAEIVRVSLGAGAGLLRTYDLAYTSGDNSRLSHQLEPLSLFDLRAEFIAPVVPVSLALNAAFRPVRYNIRLAEQGEVTPSGSLFDVMFLAGYHIGIAGSGKQTYKIIPAAGVRLGLSNVDDHPGDVVLSSTTLAAVAGLGLRLPFNDVLEVSFGVDGGLILGYSENPATSGESASGITIGGDLQVRIWLSEAIAIAIDNRFTFETIDLEGTPTRQLPDSEQGGVQDATISTKDLRTSAGVAVRF